MIPISRSLACSSALLAVSMASPTVTADSVDERIKALEKVLIEQQDRIIEQEKQLDQQAVTISGQKKTLTDQQIGLELLRHEVLMESRGAGPAEPKAVAVSNSQQPPPSPTPVGQAPAKTQEAKPDVAALADIGGVLTPRGKLVIEPTLQYSHSSLNRVTFLGIKLFNALSVGSLEAVDVDRESYVASVTGRLGVTNRLEFELKLPYVWRHEENSTVIADPADTSISNTLSSDDFGDVELAMHYQWNNGLDGWPFFILNGRLKLTNADGPFDVARDADGNALELSTGSGFYSFEPSITALYPSAPAVFFGNIGYLVNIEDDVNTTLRSSDGAPIPVGLVDPGDAFRLSFGMAYSINERASFTVGFKNDWIQATETQINGTKQKDSKLNIGSMLLGYSFQLTPKKSINLNLEFGITDDAPDMSITLRMPFTTDPFWQ